MKSFCSILAQAAAEIPDKPLFAFPENRWRGGDKLTYSDLALRSGAASQTILEHARSGQRALLLFPTGAAFWEAFMGCLASGVMAVPLNIPNLNRGQDQLQEICQDCTPSVLMTDEKTAEVLRRRADQHPHLGRLPVITPDQWRAHPRAFNHAQPPGDGVAFLQYTSGSTARPKGVQVSHGNLLANLEMIRDQMGIRMYDEGIGVTWLPHYHDMGLVGSYLTTLFTKNTTLCLQPEEFVLQPARWLQLMSEHRTPIGGGPDFAYRLCVEKIQDDQLEGIDLSAWRVAFVGAERIRPATLHNFAEKFSSRGFRSSAFFPCYGLGEATLLVTGGPRDSLPVVRQVSSSALTANRIEPPSDASDSIDLASCGQTFSGSRIAIVDSKNRQLLQDEKIGEVCVSGPSVTRGYFQRQNLNEQLFCDMLIDGQNEKLLLTGDLGFRSKSHLFITGRSKELIVVRGRNFYPEDIEQRICDSHPALLPDGAIAFSVELGGQESLVVAVELQRSAVRMESYEPVITAIRHSIVEVFAISPAEILLFRPATIPRTSSGKPRRMALRESYSSGAFECVYREKA